MPASRRNCFTTFFIAAMLDELDIANTLTDLSLNNLVELHVLYVPDDQWDVKLNKVPAEAIESFISAGFIRVYPDITLKTLRNELGALLGAERTIDRFSFLKCVGRSLALVSAAGCHEHPFTHTLVVVPLACLKVTESPAVLSRPVRCTSPPPGLNLAMVSQKKSASPVFHTNRKQSLWGHTQNQCHLPSAFVFCPLTDCHGLFLLGEELIKEIKLVREERKQLEWTRQELLRKGKDLLAQNRHRRNQGNWKKKYFETKKATAPLEENLRNLRQELETFYNKLLHQLQARDSRGKPRRQADPEFQNELIIQILTESHVIDNLKRKVEDAKMKLVTEIKVPLNDFLYISPNLTLNLTPK
uniref:Spermatosis associated 1 n=1 Tax=Labrus bergylta TaxID=56723 RepID=A0A3Q3GP25_9LABR